MDTPTDTPTPAAKPVRIPPSVGGSGLSIVAGILVGRNTVETLLLGSEVPVGAWVVPAVMLAFVVALIQLALLARARMGVQVDPSSIRRQWVVVVIAFVMGVVGGGVLPYVQLN